MPATMTSRERLQKALNHQQPDRVPVDIGGTCQLTGTLERKRAEG